MKNNILVGVKAGELLTSGNYNLCLGEGAGEDITDQSNQIRIGKGATPQADNMVIFQNGRVVISKEVFEFIFKDTPELVEEVYNLDERKA